MNKVTLATLLSSPIIISLVKIVQDDSADDMSQESGLSNIFPRPQFIEFCANSAAVRNIVLAVVEDQDSSPELQTQTGRAFLELSVTKNFKIYLEVDIRTFRSADPRVNIFF